MGSEAMICPSCGERNDDQVEVCFNCRHVLHAICRGSVISSRYEILSALGRGGMGMVYKAHDRVLDETVAVKVLRPDIARNPDLERRFRDEIKLARRVGHRNVCRIYEYGEDSGLRYISMEYIEGADLRRELRQKGALLPEEAFHVAIQVAQGLEAIHELGIIHRDLKTPNLMRDGRGVVRLMDFGIAKQLGAEGATTTGFVVGTPEYMSPEQARGERLDFRSDIYALGIVIYELFTGHVPFRGDTPVATILKQLNDAPLLQGPEAPRIPEPLIPVLQKALAKNPTERHATAEELVHALRSARAETFPQTSITPTPLPRPPATPPETPTEPHTPRPTPLPVPAAVEPEPDETAPHTTTPVPISPEAIALAEGEASPDATERVPTPVPLALPHSQRSATTEAVRPSGPPQRETRPTAGPRPLPRKRIPVWSMGAAALVLAGGAFLVLRQRPSLPPAPSAIPETTAPAPPLAVAEAPLQTTEAPPATAAPAPPPPPPPVAAPTVTPTPSSVSPSPRERAASPPARRPASFEEARPTPRPASPPASTLPTTAAAASPLATPHVEPSGLLHVSVVPSAELSIDGTAMGKVSTSEIPLPPGTHLIRLTHPDYQPLQRKVTIFSGQSVKLVVDLGEEAVPRKR